MKKKQRKPKTLVEFIELIGDKTASEMFDINRRYAAALRQRDRYPSPKLANVIVKKTLRHKSGPVTFEGIYKI